MITEEYLNFVGIPSHESDPVDATNGELYANTKDGYIYLCDGYKWHRIEKTEVAAKYFEEVEYIAAGYDNRWEKVGEEVCE